MADRVEFRVADYREVSDGPFDAIASIGMVEHVGVEQIDVYARRLSGLLRPGGRLLNHGIAKLQDLDTPDEGAFSERFVFPDGVPLPLSRFQRALERAGLETRHVEGLPADYARTLGDWIERFDAHWDDAVRLAGIERARIWRCICAAAGRASRPAGRRCIRCSRTAKHFTAVIRWGIVALRGRRQARPAFAQPSEPRRRGMSNTVPVTLNVNGVEHHLDVEPRLLLVHDLRDVAGLTGTHVGCDTSNCGACTIRLDGKAVKSCTVLAVQADGAALTTIEGWPRRTSCIRSRRPSGTTTGSSAGTARRG